MIDQRKDQRRAIVLSTVAGGSVQCTLLDVSRSGAKLETRSHVPDRFYLMLQPTLKRWCQVIWRKHGQVGVKFIPDPTHQGQ
jgi:hypothetical protein